MSETASDQNTGSMTTTLPRQLLPGMRLLALLLGLMVAIAGADHVEFEDLPEAVRDTLGRVAASLSIEEIETRGHGGSEFEIEGRIEGGARVEIVIAQNGELLSFENDSDEDGIGDAAEAEYGTDPDDHDSDDDTFPDGFESDRGADPMNAESRPEIVAIHIDRDGGEPKVIVDVQTFPRGEFQLETRRADGGWVAVGAAEAGDGTTLRFELPLAQAGLFRVVVKSDGEAGGGEGSGGEGGSDGGGSGPAECGMPDDFVGMEIVMVREGESRSLHFTTDRSGDLVKREDGEVEAIAFEYSITMTGDCSAKVVVTFPSDDEGNEYEVFEFTFTSETAGTYRSQDFEDGKGEDPESGNFTVNDGDP